MSVSAYVSCRCVQDGLHVPEKFRCFFDESLPQYGGAETPEEQKKYSAELDEWLKTACPHPDMYAWYGYVSNWPSLRMLQGVLVQSREKRFASLMEAFDECYMFGQVSAELAGRMLAEIEYAKQLDILGARYALLDPENGRVVYEHIPAYEGVELRYEGGDMGVDREGFFIRQFDPELRRMEVVFRSREFVQEWVPAENPNNLPIATYIDLASGARREGVPATRYEFPIRAPKDRSPIQWKVPSRLVFERQVVTYADHEFILGNLEALCRASVETGNQIWWLC